MSEVFDRLAKTVAKGVSRRDALKGLAGLLAGGFLALLPGRARADRDDDDNDSDDAIEAACRKTCQGCQGKKRGAFGRCMAACIICTRRKGTLCGSCSDVNSVVTCCLGKASCCKATKTTNAYCTNLTFDVRNCGACGNNCYNVKGATARMGCCPDSKGNPTCTDLTSSTNCGRCGRACASGTSCKAITFGRFTFYACEA